MVSDTEKKKKFWQKGTHCLNLPAMISEAVIKESVQKLFAEIEFPTEPEGLYEPLSYMISIGGKRIRPTLCLTAFAVCGGARVAAQNVEDKAAQTVADNAAQNTGASSPAATFPAEILEPAAALEVFHTFTLIHDDIMDRSPLRRGQQTVWVKWKEDTAILSGDVMLIDAYKRIAKAPAAVKADALDLFSKTAAEVCEGQQYDMDFENEPCVSMSRYENMIRLKTAVLIACSAKMGAILAQAPVQAQDALYRYGLELGMAFQVADDYLDAYGNEKVFGKPIGGDIVNGKKCWLTTRAQQKAAGTAYEEQLAAALSLPTETDEQKAAKIDAVRDIYGALGVPQDAQQEIRRYSDMALAALEPLNLGPEQTAILKDFAEKLVGRAK